MAMLRVSEDVKTRLDRYIAARHIVLGEKMTANETLTQLLDVGEQDVQDTIAMRGIGFDELTRKYVAMMVEKRRPTPPLSVSLHKEMV